jgi:arginase family enzyme
MPGGLDLAELAEVLAPLTGAGALAGFSLGCYNPEKDPAARGAQALVQLLTCCLSASS